jgi:serine phosphatase RsbU (regulator of sigma subunit)/Tfp pilus assembly protein PilF
MTRKIYILSLLLFFSLLGYSQSDEDIKIIDSLKLAIDKEKQDTSKAKTLFLLAKMYSDIDPNIAIKYLNEAKGLMVNASNDRILSDISNQLGYNYYYLGDFNSSLKYFLEMMKICERQNNILGIAAAHNNIGSIYFELNDTTNALSHHLEALRIRKKHSKNDKDGKNEIAMSYGNVGKSYFAMNDYAKAMEYYQLSLNLSKELGNKQREALMLNNIGSVLAEQGKYDEAYPNFINAYNIYLEADSPEKIALCLNNIAEVHYRKGEYEKSAEHYKKSLVYSEKVSALSDMKNSYDGLQNCYIQLNDFKEAYMCLQKYFELKDSIFSEENTVQMNELLAKFDSDKKEQEIKLLQKEKEMSSWLRNSLIAGSVLLVFLAFALYSRNKVKQKANVELSVKNKNIEEQKQIVEEQKLKLEVHQKEIVDSINYAKRIQYALLANENLLNKNLPNHFVYFNPKDIVSGDFYWAAEHADYFYLAVCDCTGHGVPGAFMSLLNIGFLSEAIKEKGISEPNAIFNYVRARLIESISMEDQKDGMDGILLRFSKTDNSIVYAAAHNAPIIVSGDKLIELPKDKIPVGKGEQNNEFNLFTINYQKGDVLYLYTDGYADQFGGAKGKKFKYKQLNELILSQHTSSLQEQKNNLSSAFNNWKGDLEQVDDVCVIGIKL